MDANSVERIAQAIESYVDTGNLDDLVPIKGYLPNLLGTGLDVNATWQFAEIRHPFGTLKKDLVANFKRVYGSGTQSGF